MNKFYLILAILIPTLAFSGVNIKNGNFYITYKDISVPEGKELSILELTIPIEQELVGWNGLGSEVETRLEISADGSVTVHEMVVAQ